MPHRPLRGVAARRYRYKAVGPRGPPFAGGDPACALVEVTRPRPPRPPRRSDEVPRSAPRKGTPPLCAPCEPPKLTRRPRRARSPVRQGEPAPGRHHLVPPREARREPRSSLARRRPPKAGEGKASHATSAPAVLRGGHPPPPCAEHTAPLSGSEGRMGGGNEPLPSGRGGGKASHATSSPAVPGGAEHRCRVESTRLLSAATGGRCSQREQPQELWEGKGGSAKAPVR